MKFDSTSRPAACRDCTLDSLNGGFQSHNLDLELYGEGRHDADIIIVGEALGENEAATGRPFVGGTGSMLRVMMRQAGLTNYYITNTVKCHPPGNRDPSRLEILHCTNAYLWDELERIKPNLIIPVGNIALRAIFPNAPAGITSVRGTTFETKWGKVLPIVHPSFVRRGNPEFWAITVFDLMKAQRESQYPEVRRPPEHFITEPGIWDITDITHKILKEGAPFSWDLETSGRGAKTNIFCIGFAWSPWHAICIPFLRRGGEPYWDDPFLEKEAWACVAMLLQSKNTKIGQNVFTFDIPVINGVGMAVYPPQYDTLIDHHVVATELPHSLEFLSSIYTDIGFFKQDMKKAGGTMWAPDEVTWTYNCRDCTSDYMAHYGIRKEMVELGQF